MPTPIAIIWNAVSDTKVQAIMAPRTSKPKQAIPLADFAADIERRRLATDVTDLPRNTGKRRTLSKKALLRAIEAAGGKW